MVQTIFCEDALDSTRNIGTEIQQSKRFIHAVPSFIPKQNGLYLICVSLIAKYFQLLKKNRDQVRRNKRSFARNIIEGIPRSEM